jgi:hypothetical protein
MEDWTKKQKLTLSLDRSANTLMYIARDVQVSI